MKIIDTAKTFVKEHKPEIIATTILVGAAAFVGAVAMTHRNCLTMTKELVETLDGGERVYFARKGVEYIIVQNFGQ